MKYIRVNFNEEYRDIGGERRRKKFLSLLILLMVVSAALNIYIYSRSHTGRMEEITRLETLIAQGEENITSLSREAGSIRREISDTVRIREEMGEVLRLAAMIPEGSVSRTLYLIEDSASHIDLYLDEISIRGDEISLYIHNPRTNIHSLMDAFEVNFRRIVISEYSRDRLTLRLGDTYDS